MVLTDAEKATTVETLVKMFQSGSVDLKSGADEKLANPAKLKSYVVGLLNDFLRKDKRVNGGEAYTPKAPGTRAGSSDETIKELRKLRKAQEGNAEAVALIDKEIEERLASMTKKVSAPKIDYSKIPSHIMGFISK
jgi:hypothetical protein